MLRTGPIECKFGNHFNVDRLINDAKENGKCRSETYKSYLNKKLEFQFDDELACFSGSGAVKNANLKAYSKLGGKLSRKLH